MEGTLDYLNFNQDDKIKKRLLTDEKILLSVKVTKFNHRNKAQERYLLITTHNIYNIAKVSVIFKENWAVKRRIGIQSLTGVSISSASEEFTIHCADEYDYRMRCDKRKEIVRCLQGVYNALKDDELKVLEFGEADLRKRTTTKADARKGVSRMPEELRSESNGNGNGSHLSSPSSSSSSPSRSSKSPETTSRQEKESFAEGLTGKSAEETSIIYSRSEQRVTFDDFEIIKVIGRGSFGKVMLVEKKDNSKAYAMKTLRKDRLIEKDQVEHTRTEKHILESVRHPFLVGLEFAFQTPEKICFVMEYMIGGELFYHLQKARKFSEDRARFYGAQIAVALGHLHSLNMIYRDLKPENILLDIDGNLKLTDFGMAKQVDQEESSKSFCGTPEYLAPEILTGEGHTKAVDWWSFGILLYEMMVGIPPYYNQNVQLMYQLIKHAELRFPSKRPLSDDATDIIKKLLNRNQAERMGSDRDIEEIKRHPFFGSIDFEALEKKELEPPFRPVITDKYNVDIFDSEFTKEEAVNSVVPNSRLDLVQKHEEDFKDFSCIGTAAIHEAKV
mmetsp:Transcript_1401/g.1467  ORF Transcript_1401/g.1467 Transcript_1401/m.1467 type:complete len:559 (+) Transcript_1401:562-2238(+)|eukprot:CAMPEP_0115007636 /NCGR_PEP_ID=MMETSP0216-20121206/21325_1 /TAXON_ID=223996 /ORGANISM="Protocruzia adherens, Strain Boccale" /LENGTH=558 /DNA_ID=CAMNT_0002374671 /DNA_START=417 /DNA_END=2093 /DNA_ORIENTATION=-